MHTYIHTYKQTNIRTYVFSPVNVYIHTYVRTHKGLFNAPAVVGESLKGAELVAEIMQNRFVRHFSLLTGPSFSK